MFGRARHLRPFEAALTLVLGFSGALCGQDPTPILSPDMSQLVLALQSPDWEAREEATRRLLELGEAIRAPLLAARPHLSLEGQIRIDAILARLVSARQPVEVVLEPTRLSLAFKDLPLREAVERIAAALGWTIRPSKGFRHMPDPPLSPRWERPVSLSFDGVPAFQAIDLLCEHAGLRFHRDYQTGDLLLAEGAGDAGLARYVGPFRVALTTLSITRQTRFAGPPSTTASIQLRVDVEDSAEVLGILQPLNVPPCRDDRGREVTFARPPNLNRYLVALEKRQQVFLSASFEPPERDAAALVDLVIPFSVLVPAEMVVFEAPIPQLPAPDGPPRDEGPIGVRIVALEEDEQQRVLTISFLPITADGIPGLQAPPRRDVIEVLDAFGNPIPAQIVRATQSEGRDVRVLAMARDAEPAAVRVRVLAQCRVETLEAKFERVELP